MNFLFAVVVFGIAGAVISAAIAAWQHHTTRMDKSSFFYGKLRYWDGFSSILLNAAKSGFIYGIVLGIVASLSILIFGPSEPADYYRP